jgi:hypothetical protein
VNLTKKDLKRKENLERLTSAIVSVMLRDEKSGNSIVFNVRGKRRNGPA